MKPDYRNYHMSMSPTLPSGSFDRPWRCDYCGQTEPTIEALRATQCSHVYTPCKACGGSADSNECKADCPLVLDLLARPDVYVIGKDHHEPS